jgi:putative ABC transport system permease protein
MSFTRGLVQIWEGILMAFHSLRANKLRALLTTLGVMIGVSTVMAILTMISGMNTAFSEQISSIGSDVLFIDKFPWGGGMEYFKYRNRKDITTREAEAIAEQATLVKAVSPTVLTRGRVKFQNETIRNVQLHGVTEPYVDIANAYPEQGRFLTALEVKHRRNVCVVGWEVASRLFQGENPLGQKIFVAGHPFNVVGVLEKRGEVLGQNLDTYVYMPLGTFQRIFGSRRSVMIQVKLASPEVLEEAKDELRGILRRVRRVPANEDDDFAINQQDILTNLYESLTTGLYSVAVGIGAISLLVGGIGIMNIMLVAVTERTREIGVRKAIGARKRDILWQFLVESVVISALGGLIGIAIGFGLANLVASVSPIPANVSVLSIVVGLGFSTTVGLFFGLYPASKAAKLDPIEALRYE